MSPDTDTTEGLDAFEADLAARMGAATDTIAAEGVTRSGVEGRVTARRAARRRRQGGVVLAAAALVVAAAVGALALGADTPTETVEADDGGTTEAPSTSTEPPTTDPPATECAPTTVPGPGETGACLPAPSTSAPPTTGGAVTTAPPATEPPTTSATAPSTTTSPGLVPGEGCTPGSHPDCIDPEGDGSHVYLRDGAQCLAQPTVDEVCQDLDGDGTAGYPHTIGPDHEEQPDLDGDGQPGYPDSEGQQPDLDGDGQPGYPDSQ